MVFFVTATLAEEHSAARVASDASHGTSKTKASIPEEIVTIAPRSKRLLRRQLRRLDESIYSRYNSVNTNDDYDMVCKKYAPIGSQITRTVCLSKLHRDAVSDATEDFQDTGVVDLRISPKKHYKLVRANVMLMARSDPKLRELLIQRKALVDKIKDIDRQSRKEMRENGRGSEPAQ